MGIPAIDRHSMSRRRFAAGSAAAFLLSGLRWAEGARADTSSSPRFVGRASLCRSGGQTLAVGQTNEGGLEAWNVGEATSRRWVAQGFGGSQVGPTIVAAGEAHVLAADGSRGRGGLAHDLPAGTSLVDAQSVGGELYLVGQELDCNTLEPVGPAILRHGQGRWTRVALSRDASAFVGEGSVVAVDALGAGAVAVGSDQTGIFLLSTADGTTWQRESVDGTGGLIATALAVREDSVSIFAVSASDAIAVELRCSTGFDVVRLLEIPTVSVFWSAAAVGERTYGLCVPAAGSETLLYVDSGSGSWTAS